MSKSKEEDMAREIVQSLMPMYSEIEFGLLPRETLWKQQSFVYASALKGRERITALNTLINNKERACVLTHGQLTKAVRLYPEAAEIAFGKLPRIFDTNGSWNKEKCTVFSKYEYVIFLDPPEIDQFRELENVMGEHFGLIRDKTKFIANNT